MWEGDYELPIVVKDNADMTYSDIENLGISSPTTMLSAGIGSRNTTVPLRQIAKVGPMWSESRIVHRGGERCITVMAQFANGVYTSPVEKKLVKVMQEEIALPQGVRSEVGGEIEYGDEALPQIFGGIVIALIIVFFFLLFNFKKYGITTDCTALAGCRYLARRKQRKSEGLDTRSRDKQYRTDYSYDSYSRSRRQGSRRRPY